VIKQQNPPKISVIMPVYNCAEYLKEALASLLVQTFEDFEIIAINDGSTDNSLSILEKFAKIDKRIRVISQENSGIVTVLNRGIEESKGEYIARMDADDVSFPDRFSSQVEVFTSHPDTSLVYGNFEVIDEQGQFLYRELVPPLNEDVQNALFVRNPIAHGSVMFRKSIIDTVGYYSDDYGPTEDLELWMRVSERGTMRGTGTPLYRWRINTQGITMTNNTESIMRGKEHIEKRWKRETPDHITRSKVLEKYAYYINTYPDFGHFYKIHFLQDRAQIATKFIRKGEVIRGIKELLILASTGRTALGIVARRLSILVKIYSMKLLKRGTN
jgi:glycosyltransferase involved in cell wall biosynthesis